MFEKYKPIYSFANENLDYINNLKLRNSKVLNIGDSYDQAIYMNLLGAKEVHNTSTNLYAKYYAELKHAAIQFFNYNDFIKFFMITDLSFDLEMYKWIESLISPETNEFFKQAYKQYGSSLQLRKINIFKTQEFYAQNCVYLRNCDIYRNTQKAMKNSIFRWKCISIEEDFKSHNMYDIIVLSNTSDIYMLADNQKFKENILPYLNKLNNKGQIVFNYILGSKNTSNFERKDLTLDFQTRKSLYDTKGFNYQEYLIHSTLDNDAYDCCAILEKI